MLRELQLELQEREQGLLPGQLELQERELLPGQAQGPVPERSRHRNPWQPSQESRKCHASTATHRRSSIEDCRGHCASCHWLPYHWKVQRSQPMP